MGKIKTYQLLLLPARTFNPEQVRPRLRAGSTMAETTASAAIPAGELAFWTDWQQYWLWVAHWLLVALRNNTLTIENETVTTGRFTGVPMAWGWQQREPQKRW